MQKLHVLIKSLISICTFIDAAINIRYTDQVSDAIFPMLQLPFY